MQPHTRILASTVLALMLGAPTGALAQGATRLAATFNERYPTEQLPTRVPAPAEQAPTQPPAEQKPAQSPPEQTGTQPPSVQAPPSVLAPPSARTPVQRPAEAEPPRRPDAAQAKYVPNKYVQNKHADNVTRSARSANSSRAPSRVVVVPRSFLDAGTEVEPGERKFLDYALPPLHTPMDVVTNTGGRVGWHNSPLPGPFFPTTN